MELVATCSCYSGAGLGTALTVGLCQSAQGILGLLSPCAPVPPLPCWLLGLGVLGRDPVFDSVLGSEDLCWTAASVVWCTGLLLGCQPQCLSAQGHPQGRPLNAGPSIPVYRAITREVENSLVRGGDGGRWSPQKKGGGSGKGALMAGQSKEASL